MELNAIFMQSAESKCKIIIMKNATIVAGTRTVRNILPFLSIIIFLTGITFTVPVLNAQEGVVPVYYPEGGFAIDGNLLSRIPDISPFSADDGDFLPNENAAGTGGYVFMADGTPLDTAIAFHILDGFDAADGEIFTDGSKFNMDPINWIWKPGKAPGKDDINNILFLFASDSSGNIWFIGGGDRNKTNGNTYLDFELSQNPLYMNNDGTFSSMGPDGGRTIGDLVLSITYTNGGIEPELFVYQWDETDPGEFGYILLDPPAGTTYLATNMDSAVVVPFGAFGEYTYEESAFTEVACNINALVDGIYPCLEIKTVLAKTKASQALTAVLKDLAGPVQVNISSAPVISLDDASICYGDTATLTVNVLSGTGPYTYLWSTGDTTQSILVSPDTTTIYTVVVSGANGCPSYPDTATVIVFPLPVCSIDGPDTVCPLETVQYLAPDSLSSYLWTAYGPAMIIGDSTMQMVEIQGTGYCDTTFVLELFVTDSNGCSNLCSVTVSMIDTLAPVFNYVPDSLFLECASTVPAASPDSVMVTDNCAGDITVMVSDSVMNDTLCPNQFTLIRTWTATDSCGNISTAFQYISVFDSIPPVLYGVPADTGVCCADSIPLPANVTAIDSCDGAVDVTLTEIVSDSTSPLYFTLTRIWTAHDTCNNMVSDSMVIEVNDTLYPAGGGLQNITRNGIVHYLKIIPNPISSSAIIQFSLIENARISLELYNSMGIKVISLFSGDVQAGVAQTIDLTANGKMPGGMYILVLRTPVGIETRHVIVD